jgi:AcrR family transcriptional regulator
MARPKSEDRRAALLDAAVRVFAESGLAAPTSRISAAAGVSEGSLFTYFKTKDELLNAVYRDLRQQVASAIMEDFPHRAGIKPRLEHVFRRWVMWGAQNPAQRKVTKLTAMSDVVSEATRVETSALFAEVGRIQADALAQKKLVFVSPQVASATLKAMAEMTMDLIAGDPDNTEAHCAMGFQLLWGALDSKP